MVCLGLDSISCSLSRFEWSRMYPIQVWVEKGVVYLGLSGVGSNLDRFG